MSQDDASVAAGAQPDVAAMLTGGTASGNWALDPAGSRVEFAVRHFWGAITVRGSFGQVTGEGTVGPDGSVAGQLVMDAASLGTKNKQRDKHLRSADFFDAGQHPQVVVTVSAARPAGQATLTCQGTLEAAGHAEPVEFTAQVVKATENVVVLHAEIVVDRTKFAMTWSPLGIAAAQARATVTCRFTR